MGLSTKSAQYPFSSWLPLAMAAPTPVSSLVHRRTLVTAGYYVMFCYYRVLLSSGFLFFLVCLGVATVFLSGLSSLFENDLKKVIALSTLSQIGFLVIRLGLGIPILRFLHMISHAFFKSCMFVQVGMLIFLRFSSQDSRSFRRLCVGNPNLRFFLSTCVLRLCGQLFLRGFFRKEPILIISSSSSGGCFLLLLVILGVGFTFLYRTRIIFGLLVSGPIRRKTLLKMDFLFFSLPLWFLGVFAGYFSLLNSGLFLLGFVFIEKFILVLLPLFVVFALISYVGTFNYFRGMLLLDYITSRFGYTILKRIKVLDFFLISLIKYYYSYLRKVLYFSGRRFVSFNFGLVL